jgi:hypothetical protein
VYHILKKTELYIKAQHISQAKNKGATHKSGKNLMSGKTHTKTSVNLFHINELPKKSLIKAYKQAKLLK